jgi:hypothetical protein
MQTDQNTPESGVSSTTPQLLAAQDAIRLCVLPHLRRRAAELKFGAGEDVIPGVPPMEQATILERIVVGWARLAQLLDDPPIAFNQEDLRCAFAMLAERGAADSSGSIYLTLMQALPAPVELPPVQVLHTGNVPPAEAEFFRKLKESGASLLWISKSQLDMGFVEAIPPRARAIYLWSTLQTRAWTALDSLPEFEQRGNSYYRISNGDGGGKQIAIPLTEHELRTFNETARFCSMMVKILATEIETMLSMWTGVPRERETAQITMMVRTDDEVLEELTAPQTSA